MPATNSTLSPTAGVLKDFNYPFVLVGTVAHRWMDCVEHADHNILGIAAPRWMYYPLARDPGFDIVLRTSKLDEIVHSLVATNDRRMAETWASRIQFPTDLIGKELPPERRPVPVYQDSHTPLGQGLPRRALVSPFQRPTGRIVQNKHLWASKSELDYLASYQIHNLVGHLFLELPHPRTPHLIEVEYEAEEYLDQCFEVFKRRPAHVREWDPTSFPRDLEPIEYRWVLGNGNT
ncbi:hypothetical protein M501DRAFT_1032647 [Patellaria atrata CBS 101060]|uniref:Uncharacterized protein n=1 Tax=Patellaria atrata CBS 101060 TaxID=1346257 RepID=A0A9P4VPK8_9PEZI|nr:hypothetical protein M501DRAFT_1032647 [Patellaria atrata CBS 101060]